MKKRFSILAAVILIAFVSIYSDGQQAPAKQANVNKNQSVFSADASAERIPNLDVLRKEIKQYHDCTCKCGCYSHDIDVQADRAIAFLHSRTEHQHTPRMPAPQQKLAMVFDIDETSLSNYQEMLNADFAYDGKVFDKWVQSAQAPAIPGSLRLFKEAQRLGVSVFFVTGRHEDERDATERNLRAQGFENWQQLTLRPLTGGAKSTIEYKSAVRAQIVADGYKIVLNVGDQWSDLRGKPEAEFSVKYPDPFYFLP